MKKLLMCAAVIITVTFSQSVFAQETSMTRLNFMDQYFSTLFPKTQDRYPLTPMSFSDTKYASQSQKISLKKAIYHGLLKNRTSALGVDEVVSEKLFNEFLKKHFGYSFAARDIPLTQEVFDREMRIVSGTFAFKAILALNAGESELIELRSEKFEDADNYDVLLQVYDLVSTKHVDSANFTKEDLIYGAAKGIAEATDDQHTAFLEPVDSQSFSDNLNGDYEGIGTYITRVDKGKFVFTPLNESPAQKAGLLAGDVLVKVNAWKVTLDSSESEVAARIKGPKGSRVSLTINRDGEEHVFRVLRDKIDFKFVSGKLLDESNYYIKLDLFGRNSSDDFLAHLTEFKNSQAGNLIIDLRNNPGGSVREVTLMLEEFVRAPNAIMSIKGQRGTSNIKSTNSSPYTAAGKDILILINEGSASASEIFAGTLNEYMGDTVTLIGETTFGKGSVQSVVNFKDGSLLKITTSLWYTGKDQVSVHDVGLSPEINVKDNPNTDVDEILEKAKSL